MYEYVRILVRHCFECQCLNNKPASQRFGDLPKKIVHYETMESFNIWLWTLLVSLRADHLEVTESFGTDVLIMALFRFPTKQRCSTLIRTDKGGSFESGHSELLYSDQKINSWLADVDWNQFELEVGVVLWEYYPHYGPEFNGFAECFVKLAKIRVTKDMKAVHFTAEGFRTFVELVMESINSHLLTPMKKGAEWIMMNFNRKLKAAGISSDVVLVDESKTTFELYENIPKKRSQVLIQMCIVRNGEAVRRVVVQLLNATGKLMSFWNTSSVELFHWILCGRIHDLIFPVIPLNCCLSFYKSRLLLLTGIRFQHLRKCRLSLKVLKRTTIKPRVDEDVAVIGRLIGEEVGHTTGCSFRLLQENAEYEVIRLVPQEDLYSADQDCVVKEKKSDSNPMSTLVAPSCNSDFNMELTSNVYLTESGQTDVENLEVDSAESWHSPAFPTLQHVKVLVIRHSRFWLFR
jgi:hypothetical protein